MRQGFENLLGGLILSLSYRVITFNIAGDGVQHLGVSVSFTFRVREGWTWSRQKGYPNSPFHIWSAFGCGGQS